MALGLFSTWVCVWVWHCGQTMWIGSGPNEGCWTMTVVGCWGCCICMGGGWYWGGAPGRSCGGRLGYMPNMKMQGQEQDVHSGIHFCYSRHRKIWAKENNETCRKRYIQLYYFFDTSPFCSAILTECSWTTSETELLWKTKGQMLLFILSQLRSCKQKWWFLLGLLTEHFAI